MSSTSEPKPTKEIKKGQLKELAIRLGVVQREAKDLGIPALVVIEALDATEKGLLLNQLLLEIDSRAYSIYSTHAKNKPERAYPLLWRFWNHTPQKGMIQFYDRSSYYLVLDSWAEGKLHEDELDRYWNDIRNYERQLADDGVQIVKIFLTVPKKTQAKRLQKLESNSKTSWRVTSKDWKRHSQYKPLMEKFDSMIEATNQDFAQWHTIDTEDRRAASIEMFETIILKLEAAVDEKRAAIDSEKRSNIWIPYTGKNYLEKVRFEDAIDRSEYKEILKERQEQIFEIAHDIHYHQIPVVMAYCGWDAAGKGGCIKRMLHGIDPRGYKVIPVGAPTKVELSHHYLWRFWKEMPTRGRIAIFDRSWYGRVLVERVEGLCTNEEWQRAYQEINEMEKHLADFGTCIVKFWLHISKDVQLERFEARQRNPYKKWKITDEDWRNRDKWERYEEAVNEMIDQTDTKYAPWNIVPSVCKMSARIKTLDVTINQLEQAIKRYKKAVL